MHLRIGLAVNHYVAGAFEMLPGYDNSSFQDLWWGVVGTSPFTLHEACLTEQRGSGKNRRTVTVFEGSIMALGFTRAFTGTTVIEPNGERRKFLIGGEKETATIGGIELGRVDLVDPRFEERFTVWSNDQVEARYLLHPVMMERLIALETSLHGKRIRCAFENGDLLVAVEGGNLFEPGDLFKPLVDPSRARRIVDEIASVVKVMDQVLTAQNMRPR